MSLPTQYRAKNASGNVLETNFVTVKEAAKIVDYTPDYIARLAREGKVIAQQQRRGWLVSIDSVKQFSLEQEAEQRRRQAALREARLREYAQQRTQEQNTRVTQAVSTSAVPALLLTSVVAVCVLLVSTLGWVVVREGLQPAQLWQGADVVLENVARVLPAATIFNRVEQTAAPVPADQVQIIDGALYVPEGSTVQSAISDPVQMTITSSTKAIIEPVFSNSPGELYQLEVQPIDTSL